MEDLPDFSGDLLEPDFKAAEAEGQFIYGYVRQRNSQESTFKARTLYYVGKASRAARVTEKHNSVPVPKNKQFIQILKRGLTEEEANYWECYYIAKLGRIDQGTGILRNRTDGGEGTMGHAVSEDQKQRRNATLAITAANRWGFTAEEWKAIPQAKRTKMGKSRKIAESYGLTIKEWFSLSDEEKIKLKSDNSEQVKDAAAKWGLTEEEYRAIPAPARRNLPRISETAQDNGYTWQEWLKLSNSEKQSIGKLQATAKKYGFNTKEYMSLNKNERVVIKQQISKAQKYGYSLTEWRTMSHKEQCKAAAINRARKAATQFEVSAEIWVELTSTQREKIRDRFKRGRRVPELLEDL